MSKYGPEPVVAAAPAPASVACAVVGSSAMLLVSGALRSSGAPSPVVACAIPPAQPIESPAKEGRWDFQPAGSGGAGSGGAESKRWSELRAAANVLSLGSSALGVAEYRRELLLKLCEGDVGLEFKTYATTVSTQHSEKKSAKEAGRSVGQNGFRDSRRGVQEAWETFATGRFDIGDQVRETHNASTVTTGKLAEERRNQQRDAKTVTVVQSFLRAAASLQCRELLCFELSRIASERQADLEANSWRNLVTETEDSARAAEARARRLNDAEERHQRHVDKKKVVESRRCRSLQVARERISTPKVLEEDLFRRELAANNAIHRRRLRVSVERAILVEAAQETAERKIFQRLHEKVLARARNQLSLY